MNKNNKYVYCILFFIGVYMLFSVYGNEKTEKVPTNNIEKNVEQTEKVENKINEKIGEKVGKLQNKRFEGIEEMSQADLYEFTKNNFYEGFSYELQTEDLEELKKIIVDQKYLLKKGKLQKETERYILNLYNKEGKKIEAIIMDTEGHIFIDEDTEINSDTLKKFLDKLLKK